MPVVRVKLGLKSQPMEPETPEPVLAHRWSRPKQPAYGNVHECRLEALTSGRWYSNLDILERDYIHLNLESEPRVLC
jgi:hypothetical protein